MAVSEEELKVKITADTDDYKRKLEEAQRKLDEFGRKGKTSVDPVTQSVNTLKKGLATLGVGAFLKDSWQAYSTQIEAETKLATVMKQRLGATDAEVESIKRLASEQQKLGVVGDEVQLAGAQQLLTFVNQKGVIEELLPAMNNLVAQQNGYHASASSAVSVATMMGKALQGQTSALSRVGISFTEAQENVLKFGTEEEKAATLAEVIKDNVGETNSALRNTPNGQVVALANDFGDLKEQIGEAFQPLVQTAIPLLSQAVADAVPLVQAFGSGLEVISGAINSLSPEMRQLILYVGLGAVAFRTLSFAVGGSTAGLLLAGAAIIGIIGKFRQAEKEASGAANGVFDGAADSADKASVAVDGLNSTITEAAASIGGLASFDEITKLSGNSNNSIASKIATADDIANIEAATNAANGLQDMLNGIEAPEVDWSGLVEASKEVGGLIIKSLFGTDEEKYSALTAMNEWVKTVFGAEWSQNWQKFGSDIYTAINGGVADSDKAIVSLADDLRNIEWLPGWTDYWMNVGSDIFDGVNAGVERTKQALGKFIEGYYAMSTGDWGKAFELFGESFNVSASTPSAVVSEVIKNQAWYGAEQMSDYTAIYSQFVAEEGLFGDLDKWLANKFPSGSGYSESDIRDPAVDYFNAMTAANGASNWATGGVPSYVINNYIDGEEVASRVEQHTADYINMRGGRGS